MYLKSFWALLLFFYCSASLACSCDWGGAFLKSSSYQEALIFQVRVISITDPIKGVNEVNSSLSKAEELKRPIQIKFQIIENLGAEFPRKTITIEDSNGDDCLMAIRHKFEIGKFYIIRALPINRKSSYGLSTCSQAYLYFDQSPKQVRGNIRGRGTQIIPYHRFIKKLKRRIP